MNSYLHINGVLCNAEGSKVSDDEWRAWHAERMEMYRAMDAIASSGKDRRVGRGISWNRSERESGVEMSCL